MAEIDRYDYELPKSLIAQTPLPRRADARLLLVDRQRNSLYHHHIRDLPDLLQPTDCLVLNDTRVVPARLVGYRTKTGGRWEGLYLETTPEGLWRVLGKTRGTLTTDETITLLDLNGVEDIQLQVGVKEPGGVWLVRPKTDEATFPLLHRVGRIPLPPYIRKGEMVEADREQYQTVFARTPGAVAAPTAGLHFTEALLRSLQERGMTLAWVTLHVGQGTFRPIEAGSLAEHPMHSEWAHVGPETVDAVEKCRSRGGRVVAIGTTVVRVLETAGAGGRMRPFTGRTELFIRPPYRFHVIDALLTNFHLPRTTLLVLVRTFGGDELVMRAYAEAIREEYRFYSYGDAMLIV
ncbi:MAG: tRNA preQ1(34) S-adenosylmethionine ribosyltransferase-isomerase QueA [Pirellulales bacterium]|nr:tRNA preQ1(34) S-adenosylmethionine ribosyltransferase-isomerase QueA [Pirellulales bacterium]